MKPTPSDKDEEVTFLVKVIPNSSANQILLGSDNALVVKLTTPPVEGKANKDLVKLISKKLGVPQSDVVIKRGERSRNKVLVVRGISTETFKTRLTG